MPKTPADNKGDRLTRAARTSSTDPTERSLPPKQEDKDDETPIERYANTSALLQFFALRHHGWLRLVPDRDGGQVHLKWKFTAGEWPNHYVYVRVASEEVRYGLELLQNKILAVESGLLKPTPDTYYAS